LGLEACLNPKDSTYGGFAIQFGTTFIPLCLIKHIKQWLPAIFLAFSKFLMGGIVGSQKFVVVANASFFLVVLVLEIYVLFFTDWLHDVNNNNTNRAIGKGHSLLI
jgi:hypothetical protein